MKKLSSFFTLLFLVSALMSGQRADLVQQMKDDYKKVHEHLYNELIPFWEKNAVDKQYGGFLTNFDANGQVLPMPEKYLNTQCRMIWWFSQLNSIAPSDENRNKVGSVSAIVGYFYGEFCVR